MSYTINSMCISNNVDAHMDHMIHKTGLISDILTVYLLG